MEIKTVDDLLKYIKIKLEKGFEYGDILSKVQELQINIMYKQDEDHLLLTEVIRSLKYLEENP